jgi:outer membrane lipopolysaccharide assembly protein LptE/RlpB
MKIIFSILFFLATTGCGFKVLNHTEIKNYEILEIKAEGDNKVNFFLKSELNNLLNANRSVDKLIISINTKKTKSIKEKNKKNQITKYNINVDSSVELNFINKGLIKTILLNREGFYNVNINHSITLNNQRNVEKNLNDKLSQDLSNKIIKIINDF